MGNRQSKILILCVLCVSVSVFGCGPIPKGALQADATANVASSAPRQDAAGGRQDVDHGWAVGPVQVNGGTLVALAAVLAPILLAAWARAERRSRGRRRAIDVLVRHNNNRKISESEKETIRRAAERAKAEKYLKPRVLAVRKKNQCECAKCESAKRNSALRTTHSAL